MTSEHRIALKCSLQSTHDAVRSASPDSAPGLLSSPRMTLESLIKHRVVLQAVLSWCWYISHACYPFGTILVLAMMLRGLANVCFIVSVNSFLVCASFYQV